MMACRRMAEPSRPFPAVRVAQQLARRSPDRAGGRQSRPSGRTMKNTEPVAPSSTTPTSLPPGLAASAYNPRRGFNREALRARRSCNLGYTAGRRQLAGQQVRAKSAKVSPRPLERHRRVVTHPSGDALQRSDPDDYVLEPPELGARRVSLGQCDLTRRVTQIPFGACQRTPIQDRSSNVRTSGTPAAAPATGKHHLPFVKQRLETGLNQAKERLGQGITFTTPKVPL